MLGRVVVGPIGGLELLVGAGAADQPHELVGRRCRPRLAARTRAGRAAAPCRAGRGRPSRQAFRASSCRSGVDRAILSSVPSSLVARRVTDTHVRHPGNATSAAAGAARLDCARPPPVESRSCCQTSRRGREVIFVKHDEQPWHTWRPGVKTRMWSGASAARSPCTWGSSTSSPGTGAPLHWHYYEEHVTLLEGTAEVFYDGEREMLEAPATVVFMPRRCTASETSARRRSTSAGRRTGR